VVAAGTGVETAVVPFLRDRAPVEAQTVAYVCTDGTCSLPISNPEELNAGDRLKVPLTRSECRLKRVMSGVVFGNCLQSLDQEVIDPGDVRRDQHQSAETRQPVGPEPIEIEPCAQDPLVEPEFALGRKCLEMASEAIAGRSRWPRDGGIDARVWASDKRSDVPVPDAFSGICRSNSHSRHHRGASFRFLSGLRPSFIEVERLPGGRHVDDLF